MTYQNHCVHLNHTDGCNNETSIALNTLFISIFSILLLIVMLIGVVGNLLVIYVVLNYGRLKTVTNTYLLHLALSDLVFLSGIPFFVSSLITRGWIFGGFVCKLFFLTQGVNQYTSIIILALLSFDRYLAVCYSAKSIVWRSRVNPNLLLILTWILSFVLMLPIIAFTTAQYFSLSKVQCTINFPYSDSRVVYYIFVAYTSTITFVFPLSLMTYFYIKIVRRLKHRVSQQHRRSRTSIRTRRKVSVLVLAVISVHICCCSPYWAFQVMTTSEVIPQTSSILIHTSSICQFLLFVNSATNPVLYAFLSENFRLSFKRVFYCCLSTNDTNYLHEKTALKRNLSLPPTRSNSHRMKKSRMSTATMASDSRNSETALNNQRLSISTKYTNQLYAHSRHSSLAPTMSIFTSETSFVSDM
ncbi:unnamed protein product [Adineta ricciae]|uniref:G-protein coupled receptors family 1 profile domain-containing protein n=1 Tax=Adineta ricciae TaxID=249248 RepID=A0A813XMU6_ADIRI|nr:unnamed protein product [Adineta ricciae]CAF0869186.1 unnamed protein product [Adineta ricciae]